MILYRNIFRAFATHLIIRSLLENDRRRKLSNAKQFLYVQFTTETSRSKIFGIDKQPRDDLKYQETSRRRPIKKYCHNNLHINETPNVIS